MLGDHNAAVERSGTHGSPAPSQLELRQNIERVLNRAFMRGTAMLHQAPDVIDPHPRAEL